MTIQELVKRLWKIRNEIETDRYTMENLTTLIIELEGRADTPPAAR